ncbi:hypothetical protein ABH935_005417 [Catenulispora sp. GAS73]|uniref:DUF6197 family protein n=1 Tax=Catenulispora sp. GAS73 TaxID=3156269 RepID=UPI0035138B73
MGATTTDLASVVLIEAADLIETRGWDRTVDPDTLPETGPLSVRGALEIAGQAHDAKTPGTSSARPVSSAVYDGVENLAEYLIATMYIPIDADRVFGCPSCVQCRQHSNLPLTLIRDKACANGCALCDEHLPLADPYGYEQSPAEEAIDTWERYMTHRRDVVSVLRAAASRPAL